MVRMSLRELLVLVALVALAIVSLKYASSAWQNGMISIALIVYVGAAIVAFVDRMSGQAFAIGMVVTMTVYGALIGYGRLSSSNNRNAELTTNGRLPTTRMLRLLHQGVAHQYYVNQQTGEKMPDFDPNELPSRPAGGVPRPQPIAQLNTTPASTTFLHIGHCWWALLLGYVGGRFAQFVYARQMADARD